MPKVKNTLRLIILFCFGFYLYGLTACGSSSPYTSTGDARLSGLTISIGQLDQVFQINQYSYTTSTGFLIASVSVNATTNVATASIDIDGNAVLSGSNSPIITLSEGSNTITITVTAADGVTTQIYTVDVTRTTASSFAQQAYLKASNVEAGDFLGFRVDLDGDTLVVGAVGESSSATGGEADNSASFAGAAYVFTRSGSVWTQQAYLKASNAEANDFFGISVAIDGDTLVVGATSEASSAIGGQGDNSAAFAGAAYVFTRSGTTWTQQAYLKASNAEANDTFGASMALEGDTLVVGATGEASSASGGQADNSAVFAGTVYVFTRSGSVWTQQAYLKASNAETNDTFGYDVALSGDTLVASARQEDSSASGGETDNSAGGSGAAYVFTRSGSVWTQQAYLKASNAEINDFFGVNVTIDGDTLVVGANAEDSSATGGEADNSTFSTGAAYVFTRSGSVWTQQAYLKASNADAFDFFGYGVSLDGDTLVVTANAEESSATGGLTDNTSPLTGAAYVFTRSGGVWTQQAYLKASNADISDYFGEHVALDGDTVVIGAFQEASSATGGETDNSATQAGAFYVWQ